MKEEKNDKPVKPNETVKGHAMDYLRIVDKKTKKVLVNKRG